MWIEKNYNNSHVNYSHVNYNNVFFKQRKIYNTLEKNNNNFEMT